MLFRGICIEDTIVVVKNHGEEHQDGSVVRHGGVVHYGVGGAPGQEKLHQDEI